MNEVHEAPMIEAPVILRPSPGNGNGLSGRTAEPSAHTPEPTTPKRRSKRGEGSLFRQPGSRYWWYAIGHRGRVIRESTGETDIKKAREVLKRKRQEIAAAEGGYTTVVGPEVRQVRVSALLDGLEQDYTLRGVRSLPQVKAHLKPIREAFGDWKAVEVSDGAVDRYITGRREAEVAPATVNREMQLLGQALRPFLEKHRLPVPALRRLPEDNAREGFFERAEAEAVVSHLPDDLKDFCRFAYLTGWRKGEIASLRWADVDREGRVIRLSWRNSKNKKPRHMAVEGDLAAIVQRRWQERLITRPDGTSRVTDFVFHRKGEPIGDFRKAWASACKAAGIEGRLFHDLRRTAVRNMVRAGVPEKVAMAISGHRTRSVFDRYNVTNDDDIREATLRTQAYVRSLPAVSKVVPLRTGEGQR